MAPSLVNSRKPATLLWVSTFVLSVGLHVGLVRLNPNLFLGADDFSSLGTRQDRKRMEVQPARPELMRKELPRLLEPFDPVSSAAQTETPIDAPDPAAGLFEQGPTELPAPEVRHQPAELPGERPEMSESVSDWQPRQEVMAVTNQQVTETLDILPRTLRNIQSDQPGAPDISLPGGAPDLPGLEVAPANFQALQSQGNAGAGAVLFGLPPLTDSASASSGGSGNRPAPDLPEMTLPEMETREEITQLDAVESLLRLETRVFDDPADPHARYFKVQLLPAGLDQLPVLPRDVVYLLDCSASMTEQKLRLAVEGINESLKSLSEQDRVNVIAFRDEVELFDTEGVEASVFGKAKVRTFLSAMHARGQTDVYASLNALQSMPGAADRPMLAMLVTDGVPTQGVTDSSEIIEAFTRLNQGKISVFGLGGGGRVNRLLLDFLSFRNRGSSLVAPRAEGLPGAIVQSATEIRRPVLVNLSYQFSGVQEPEIYPENLSHLYLDRPLILIGRTRKDQPQLAFQIVGQSAKGDHDILFSLNLDDAPKASSALRQEWAWQALLQELSSSIGNPDPASRQAVQELIDTYNLVIPDAYRK
ncbi:VWA domain-containing protein [Kiritimatiellaeota bacterium B1221]|nr:VWA domain-containing protein [Kiritimatiellaeota bacterium B1221]